MQDHSINRLGTMVLMEELIGEVGEGLKVDVATDNDVPHVQGLIFCPTVPGTDLHQPQEFICLRGYEHNGEKDDEEYDDPSKLTEGYLITIAHGSEGDYHEVHGIVELKDI